MAIIRARHDRDFTMITNAAIRDPRLSNAELGLLVRMLRVVDDWHFSIAGLTSMSRDGRDGIRSALGVLEQYGYLERIPYRDSRGLSRINYVVHETPIETAAGFPAAAFPAADFPASAFPTADLPAADLPAAEQPAAEATTQTILDTNTVLHNTIENNPVCHTGIVTEATTDGLPAGTPMEETSDPKTEPIGECDWMRVLRSALDRQGRDSETAQEQTADSPGAHCRKGPLPPVVMPKEVPGKKWRGTSRPDGSIEWELYDPNEKRPRRSSESGWSKRPRAEFLRDLKATVDEITVDFCKEDST